MEIQSNNFSPRDEETGKGSGWELDSDKQLEAIIETCLSSLLEFDARLCPLQNIPEAWDVMAEMFSSIEKIKHLFPKRD